MLSFEQPGYYSRDEASSKKSLDFEMNRCSQACWLSIVLALLGESLKHVSQLPGHFSRQRWQDVTSALVIGSYVYIILPEADILSISSMLLRL